MIYTCTMTPSVDYTTYLPSFQAGALNRATQVNFYPGGKGINVSRVLKRFGIESQALGFIGGFTGDFIIQKLKEEGITSEFIQTKETTRINVKVNADVATELNGPAPTISKKQQQALLEKIKQFNKNDWFVLAGSIPNSIEPEFLVAIAKVCKQADVRLVVDTSGRGLQHLMKTKPYLVKPNEYELGELFQTTITSTDQAIYCGKQLIADGIKHVVLSLGANGAIYLSNDVIAVADPLQGDVINTVGAGDSMVAGFIAGCLSYHHKTDAFRYAVAAGSATAFSKDLCERSLVDKLVQNVSINIYE
ncbi:MULTISPECIES: 1-phosphofructokinase [Clostridia]|uniref:1-phosphofructokinase n=1 Tax=Clostridia TaxID=186801 RepID=UPI000EA10B23|nr:MULTISPECIES: 1-phosphofructokinase [Clostridia]NBJ67969.1 1-phosphofructokinase [Roseburia sp. 1XD42-34]RKI82415.1 1-phosphofructokinase [Clostridium sp. 1xD42-85]